MTKRHLQYDEDYVFSLYAIFCGEKDYRMAWLINQAVGIDFIKLPDLQIHQLTKRKLASFSIFAWCDELNRSEWFLISNKSSGNILIPELKPVDYFLKITGHIEEDELHSIFLTLKKLTFVKAITHVEPSTLKSKENFIIE